MESSFPAPFRRPPGGIEMRRHLSEIERSLSVGDTVAPTPLRDLFAPYRET